jgi:hypothetical protein
MSSGATAEELELGVEDDEGNVETVYSKVENVVSVRRLAKHHKDKRMLTVVPGALSALAIFLMGDWLLALAMLIVGAGIVGWNSVESVSNKMESDTWDAAEDDPWATGTAGQPADVTTKTDAQRADEVDIDELKMKLKTEEIDFQEYAGSYENPYYEVAYEYLVVTDHVTDAEVTHGSTRNLRDYMIGAGGLLGIVVYLLTSDLTMAGAPALVFAASGFVLDSFELPATVALQVEGDDDEIVGSVPLEERASYRRLLLPNEDAQTLAENVRQGEQDETLASEGDVYRDADSSRMNDSFTQPEEFEARVDELVTDLQDGEKVDRHLAAADLADGARKYPDLAVPATDALIDALDAPDSDTRKRAAETLQFVADANDQVDDETVERIVAELVPLLTDAHEHTRTQGANALAAWAEVDPQTVRPHLMDLLGAGTAPIQVPADFEKDGLLTALSTTLEANAEQVRLKQALTEVIVALAEPDPGSVADEIRRQLEDGTPPVVTEVGLQVLAGIADDAPDVVALPEHVPEYLADDGTRFDALYLLSELAAHDPTQVAEYAANVNSILETQAIDHDSPIDNLTANALRTLVALAEYDPDLVREPETWLPDCLTHSAEPVRYVACQLLAELGPDAVPSDFDLESILGRRLADDSTAVREAACEAVAALELTGLTAKVERCVADEVRGAEEALQTLQ